MMNIMYLEDLIKKGEELKETVFLQTKVNNKFPHKQKPYTYNYHDIKDRQGYNTWKNQCTLFLEKSASQSMQKKFSDISNAPLNPQSFNGMISVLMAVKEDALITMNKDSNLLCPDQNGKVFIIHGHDEEMKHELEDFLSSLKLEPIILNNQSNKGKTIIEKFEAESDVGYAIALFSSCDLGKAKKETEFKARARQNVIFELGFFVGKLGRGKTCIITQPDIEKPSDIDGVVYIPFDNNGGWKFDVAKELKEAGFSFDFNNII